MEKILSWKVMEKGRKNIVMEIQNDHGKVITYRELRMRNSDNSIAIGIRQCFG